MIRSEFLVEDPDAIRALGRLRLGGERRGEEDDGLNDREDGPWSRQCEPSVETEMAQCILSVWPPETRDLENWSP